ncbi:uncharacterized protein DUF4271 [Arcticibacter pallidicorallinus]|uniref:Uncharacterized protein DUF4271 n=1 Tax=Arcticibacter pallidicorallinus TaxID=1259464 RepID=A0A2T0U6N3_9SPHI|nr:DUF4271 domain-containing protein [Arcticibacter pallidicorallinus]PRY53567.1 uncharacterized protein DUF4271 [Arcticibacter pallidicorallinus]
MNFFARLLFVFLISLSAGAVQAQVDTVAESSAGFKESRINRWRLLQEEKKRVNDSLRHIGDSLSMVWIKKPDPGRENRFRDSLFKANLVTNLDFSEWESRSKKPEQQYDSGKLRKKGELWVIAFVLVSLILFAILRHMFFNELSAIIHAFFSNRVLSQINKEEKFFNSWPFVFLYLLFGFTIGMFLYQCGKYFQLSYSYSGFQWFLRLSMIVIGVFTLKVILLKFLGFLFDSVKLVKEYISILFLSYFNAALLFLPIVIAFSLTPTRFAPYYIYLSFVLIFFIVFSQFTRAISNILSSYKFPKLYLILYLCALEICPILVLIKALRF